MDDKLKFQEALVSLQSRAEEQGGVLTIEEMQKGQNFRKKSRNPIQKRKKSFLSSTEKN